MKTARFIVEITVIGIVVVFLMVLIAPSAPAAATGPKTYKMIGKISAIDLKFNTVVIDVPLTEKKIFTVAGPLAKDVTLKKGNKKNVTLKDFKVGDKVVVEWEPTPEGHLIKRLVSK